MTLKDILKSFQKLFVAILKKYLSIAGSHFYSNYYNRENKYVEVTLNAYI